MMEWHDQCFANHNELSGSIQDGRVAKTHVAFPTAGENWSFYYSPPPDDRTVIADDDVVSGRKVIVVLACFLYMSFDVVRHTSFCGTDLFGKEVSTTFGFCPVGNDAD
jgi:hypothetical protein